MTRVWLGGAVAEDDADEREEARMLAKTRCGEGAAPPLGATEGCRAAPVWCARSRASASIGMPVALTWSARQLVFERPVASPRVHRSLAIDNLEARRASGQSRCKSCTAGARG